MRLVPDLEEIYSRLRRRLVVEIIPRVRDIALPARRRRGALGLREYFDDKLARS